jgi:alpha,alpha-trehalase
VRGEPKQFTSSKMFCWVACERGARLADIREDFEQARLINAMMHVIRAEEHVALGR